MAQFGIVCFNRVCIGFSLRDFVDTPVVPQAFIDVKSVAEIAPGFRGFIHQLLNGHLCPLPNNLKAQVAAGEAIYDGNDVDLVFLSPMKVNTSSISATFTWSGTGGSGSWAACALIHNETVRW